MSIQKSISLEDTQYNTNFLKAWVILSVCVNHFVNAYVSENFGGYANGFIAIFFILSGYGIYRSSEKNIKSNLDSKNKYISFYIKRILRIYPLFWIWYIIAKPDNGFLGFLAFDFYLPSSPWFVPAILECYLATPILLFFISNFGNKKAIAFVTIIFVLLNAYFFGYSELEPVRAIGYRGLFFFHIYLFFWGFILARLPELKQHGIKKIALVFLVTFFFVNETTDQKIFEYYPIQYISPIIMGFCMIIFCHQVINFKIRYYFKYLNLIGAHSFSIYLFHRFGYEILLNSGFIQVGTTGLGGILVWIITLPIFIFVYVFIELIVRKVSIIFINKIDFLSKHLYVKL